MLFRMHKAGMNVLNHPSFAKCGITDFSLTLPVSAKEVLPPLNFSSLKTPQSFLLLPNTHFFHGLVKVAEFLMSLILKQKKKSL